VSKPPKKKGKGAGRPVTAPRLTNRQTRFVHEYLIDLNAAAAATRAGYSPAQVGTAARIMRPAHVRAAIDARIAERNKTMDITAERVIQQLGRVAFGDVREMFDIDGAVKAICDLSDDSAVMVAGFDIEQSDKGDDAKHQVRLNKVRLSDRLKALELLMRHKGMFKDVVQHTGNVAFVIET